jgi:HEAT repeat protein/energy-coupling factor transporter ATP-binding protein EcfA2
MERKESGRPKFEQSQEISPERGSEAYQQGYTETKRVEHKAFLAVVSQRKPGEHVVILGEPGAGKTTLLTKVWEELLKHEQPGEDTIVAWVPLTAVKNNELEEYLRKSWIKQFCKSGEIDRYWASFEALADAERVWLLLDGADEMGEEALSKLDVALKEAWAKPMRAIITCRLNLWDASPTNKLQTSPNFQVYRTLDFKYTNPVGQDEVKAFIDHWFRFMEEPEAGHKLRAALDEVGKERIKDLARNPLRLTLLCAIWDDDQVLPETQAGLYELFVDYQYDWKATEFPEAVKLRGELDRALGELAKKGINKPNLRFRFTEAELRQWIPVVKQRQALMDLAWLNCVGEENQRPVFTFLHPTFQEYFAACSIDDWHFFLNHFPGKLTSLDASYRVFESHWKQVYLLWLGQDKIPAQNKEDLITSLTKFNDHFNNLYTYKAYCTAAWGIAEFGSCSLSESIIKQVVNWYFGYIEFQLDNKVTVTFHRSIIFDNLVKKTLNGTNRLSLIKYLSYLINNSTYESTRMDAISCLRDFGYNNQKAVEVIIDLVNNTDKKIRQKALESLGEMGIRRSEIVNALDFYLFSKYDDDEKILAAKSLVKIDVGNTNAIRVLIDNLLNSNDDFTSRQIIHLIEKTDINHECYKALKEELKNVKEDQEKLLLSTKKLIYLKPNDSEAINNLKQIIKSDTEKDIKIRAAVALIKNNENDYTAISFLRSMLQSEYDINTRRPAIVCLAAFAPNNPDVIFSFNGLLYNEKDVKELVFITEMLKFHEVGDGQTALALTQLVNDTQDPILKGHFAECLGTIDPGNSDAIQALILFFDTTDNEESKIYAIDRLFQIGGDNNLVVLNKLKKIMDESHTQRVLQEAGWNLWLYSSIDHSKVYSLIKEQLFNSTDIEAILLASRRLQIILDKGILGDVIAHIAKSLSDTAYADKRDFYKIYFDLAIYCTEQMSYLDFHRAWNGSGL